MVAEVKEDVTRRNEWNKEAGESPPEAPVIDAEKQPQLRHEHRRETYSRAHDAPQSGAEARVSLGCAWKRGVRMFFLLRGFLPRRQNSGGSGLRPSAHKIKLLSFGTSQILPGPLSPP